MKIFKLISLSIAMLSFLCINVAQAEDKQGLFVEPGITYEMGDGDNSEITGLGVSARFGFHLNEAFFVGIDGRYSKLDFKTDDNRYSASGDSFNYGPVVGFQMPDLGLRVWGAYVVDSMIDPDQDGGIDFKIEDGSGYRIGAGFRISSVSLNLEYQKLTYDTLTVDAPLLPAGSFGTEIESDSWIASVSFPLEF